jgi:hypothetical protein
VRRDRLLAKGENILIKINGTIAGGLTSIVCSDISTCTSIKTFLTDEPVYNVVSCSYKIVITANCNAEDVLIDFRNIKTIEVIDSDTQSKYSDCFVDNIKTTINAKGVPESIVTIISYKRSVIR